MKKEFVIAQEAVMQGIQSLLEKKLTNGSWGNISARVNDEYIAITPSGTMYNKLTKDMIVISNMEGETQGKGIPSSELPMHLAIYKAYPEVQAIVHTHSPYSSAIATLQRNIPAIMDDQVSILGGKVRCAKYAMSGSEELGENTVKALKNRNACLWANHGAVCVGQSMDEAFMCAEILEKTAQIYLLASPLGRPVEINEEAQKHLRDFYLNKYSKRQQGLEDE
ncbi:MAG: class II aldolase/adducin family protein [Phascolarctobacterium sp.]|nr:class II aldolase/adducin family protein [Phascolarctobacterium sp.]